MTAPRFNDPGPRQHQHSGASNMIYIFARDYHTAERVAAKEALGRTHWRFVASPYNLLGKHTLRLLTDPTGFEQHPQYRGVAGKLATMRAAGDLIEDRQVTS